MTWRAEYAPLHAAVVHHTATPNGYGKGSVPAMIRAIYHFHAISRGWGDIGYNVIVDRFGRAWEGRAGGLHRPTIGAHAGGFNPGTVGIAMLGNYTAAKPSAAEVEMVARLVAWKLGRVGVDPRGWTHLHGGPNTRYSTRVYVRLPVVFPHKATSRTACPGRAGEAALPGIRIRAAHLMAVAPLAPRPKPTPSPSQEGQSRS
jgi:uncharacterized protein with LGFP repeats